MAQGLSSRRLEVLCVPFAGNQRKRKTEGLGDSDIQKRIFLKEVSAATPILSARDPSAMAQSL